MEKQGRNHRMITAGFDIGTRVVKVCVVEDGRIAGWAKDVLDDRIETVIKRTYKSALGNAGIRKRAIKKILATGYCSEMLSGKIQHVSEALCVSRAAGFLNNKLRTVIDIGGLFINIVINGENGRLVDAISNDKCAAGSGKFLEIVSEATEVPLDSVSGSVLKSRKPYVIKSNCAVFAKSEVISRINEGHDSNDIIASVVYSIASRAVTMLEKINAPDEITLIGGVSRIGAMGLIIEELSSRKITPLTADPQIISALGAALIAQGK
jgi:predicted CoA-substrate-specific enzyme activase